MKLIIYEAAENEIKTAYLRLIKNDDHSVDLCVVDNHGLVFPKGRLLQISGDGFFRLRFGVSDLLGFELDNSMGAVKTYRNGKVL